jgi:transposase
MQRITVLASADPAYERLRTIPGIGPTIAPALLASLGHAQQFTSARSCAAWAGLVPKQNGTGGQVQLGAITKNGNRSLRVMLIHGARTVIQWADKHDHAQSCWIKALVARRGKNKATVALANKLMRIAWVVLTQHVEYDMRKAFRAQPI